jgi:hypothetical protein
MVTASELVCARAANVTAASDNSKAMLREVAWIKKMQRMVGSWLPTQCLKRRGTACPYFMGQYNGGFVD